MTNDEFLDALPFHWGVAWSALENDGQRAEVRAVGSKWFYWAPRMFALADLARLHPEEYALLVEKATLSACERYGATPEEWKKEGEKP